MKIKITSTTVWLSKNCHLTTNKIQVNRS